MKKLLITTMAAVSVGLCAKADLTVETFELYSEGSLFGTYTDEEDGVEKYRVLDGWYTEPTLENLFTVTNIANYVGAGTYPESSDSVKALAIDTSAPLLRYADSFMDPQSLSDAPIFFDSVVQFTATDVAPSMENNTTDKLAVWLYTSPDDVATTPGLFGETLPIRRVAVTAGYLDGATLKTKNYITNIEVEPDTWHRLTIKSFKNDIGDLLFNIWVDKTQVSGKETIEAQETTTDFLSRISDAVNSDTYNKLQGVAFDGKGAVDDIVFTTTDPFAVPSYAVTVNIADVDEWASGCSKQYSIDGTQYFDFNAGDVLAIPETASKIWFKIAIPKGGKLEGVDNSSGEDGKGNYYWIKDVNVLDIISNGKGEVVLTVVGDEGGDEPTKPTVGGTSYENEADLKAVVKSGTEITVPRDWTVEDKVLKKADGTAFATFEYYNLNLASDGITVTATLDQKAAAPFAEATDLEEDKEVLEVGEDDSGNPELTVRIKPYVGLYYGAMTGSALDNLTLTSEYQKATTDEVIEFTATGKAGDTAGFIKVVVTDIPPEE